MPRLEFPIDADGLLVDAVVGLRGLTIAALLASGQRITSPVAVRGAVDTGTDITAVSAAVLRQLGVTASYQRTTQTVSGQLNVQLFVVSVGITNLGDPAASELVESDLTVMELATPLPNAIEVLIGVDVLRGCKLIVDGPAGWFALEC
jgi:hypothetical protein